jgi:uncharacterized protein involved in oxidation of intracellular sulfur
MKKLIIITQLYLSFNAMGFSQYFSSCENVTAFPKGSKPDLGIVIYSDDMETAWNAMRLAVYSQSKGDTVFVFVLGKGIDAFNSDDKVFNLDSLSQLFVSKGGQILACATCAKIRGTEDVKTCTVTSLADLYAIVKRSKKVLTF